jgi:nucleoside-diphosphate-sugar epimerase
LRYFNIYGPRQEPTSEYAAVIPIFMQRMRLGQSPVIFGDGLQTRDFVHVTDAAKAYLLACKCDTAKGQVLNVASGRGTSLIELVDAMNKLLGTSIQPVFAAARGGDIKHSRGDAARLAAALNFRPGISLAEGLSSVMASPLAQTEKAMAT